MSARAGIMSFTLLPKEAAKVPLVYKVLMVFVGFVFVGEIFAQNPIGGSVMALGMAVAGFAGRHFMQRITALEKNASLSSQAIIQLNNRFDRFARAMFLLQSNDSNRAEVNRLMNDVFES